MKSTKEVAGYAVGMWRGLIEGEWTISDLKDLGQALYSKKTLKSLLEGSKKDKELCSMIMKNLSKTAQIMLNYVDEQKVKNEAAEALANSPADSVDEPKT
jgi:hypothetical protein